MNSLEVSTDERGVTRLTLNRPAQHNAFDRALIDILQSTLARLNSNTRVLIIQGEGKSFCAGADLTWMQSSVTLSADENKADALALSQLLDTLDTLPFPTIARVHGAAMGGGTGLIACCDIAVASESARFAFSEVRLGLIPATISPYVVRAVGARAARLHFLTGAGFDALEAYRIGLIHDICSTDNLDNRVEDQVLDLLEGGAHAQGETKRLIADVSGPIDEAMREDVSQRLATVRSGDEAQERMASFFASRSSKDP